MTRSIAFLAALLLASCGPSGESDIRVSEGWTRATAPGHSSAAVYMTLQNRSGGDDRLLGLASPAAADATLHSSSSSGGIARMRPLPEGVPIPAGARVRLKPGGLHAMLTGLNEPLTAGDAIEVRLRFEHSGERMVPIRIVESSASGPEGTTP